MWWPDAQETSKFPPGEEKFNVSLNQFRFSLIRESDLWLGQRWVYPTQCWEQRCLGHRPFIQYRIKLKTKQRQGGGGQGCGQVDKQTPGALPSSP